MCCAFPRRRRKPASKPAFSDPHVNRTVMHQLVNTTTLVALTYSGSPTQRRILTTTDHGDTSNSNLPASHICNNIHSQLEHIFRNLCGRSPTTFSNRRYSIPGLPGPTLSSEKMARFLEGTQGETLVPLEKKRYHFGEFLEVWRHSYDWNASRRLEDEEIKDMSHPISHYFISSSHNTYLSGNQLSSQASIGEYKKVLEGNCRCIEIDVWNPQYRTTSKKNLSTSSPKPNHRAHLSVSSMASSAHEKFETFTNLLASKKRSRSQASSFSQLSLHTPSPGDEALLAKPVDPTALLSSLRKESRQQVAEEAIDDVDDYIEDGQDARSTLCKSETLQTSETSELSQESPESQEAPKVQTLQGAVSPFVAQISVTAPDASMAVPAHEHEEAELYGGNEPIVMHAHNFAFFNKDLSLGTHVPFRDVCRAVRHTAFTTNHMPIIISLEVHTDPDQQRKMIKIMKEEWGEHLLEAPLEGADPRLGLPSLGDLQDKILVKVKRPHTASWTAGGTNGTAQSQGVGLGVSLSTVQQAELINAENSEDDTVSTNAGAAVIKNPKITEELGSLAVYTESRHLKQFTDRDAKLPSHVFSLDEKRIKELHEKNHTELWDHNKTYLMRAYPNAAKHYRSTNPDPACIWRRGVQMVALNWQSLDEAMMLNHGMFEGTHGWVLKPPGYRSPLGATRASSEVSDSGTSVSESTALAPSKPGHGMCPVARAEQTCTLDLYITVLAGQDLPLPSAIEKRIKKNNAGKDRFAPTAGILTGRGHSHFHPVVKCELNVEHAEKRCPEAVVSSSWSVASKAGTPNLPSSEWTAAAGASPSVNGAASSSKLSEAECRHKTSASKTDHPHWGPDGDLLSFPNVNNIVESLSFITFLVEDEGSNALSGDTLAGWACIRLDRLRAGYRFVQLMNSHGDPTEGKLLVKIEKRYRP